MRNLIPLVLLLSSLTICGGCLSGLGELDVSAPASEQYVDEQVDELRTHVDQADEAIRTDVAAATTAGQDAYAQAIAEGKSEAEARAASIAAEIARSRADADEAKRIADQAAAAATDRREAGGDDGSIFGFLPSWAELLITTGLAYLGINVQRNKSRKRALKPAPKPAAATV